MYLRFLKTIHKIVYDMIEQTKCEVDIFTIKLFLVRDVFDKNR